MAKKVNTKKVVAKKVVAKKVVAKKFDLHHLMSGEKISLGQFLTLLCAGQRITTPVKEELHSGTIQIFNKK